MVTLKITRDPPSVVVLTPTTGEACLQEAIESVTAQDYLGKVTHHLVVDGQENNSKFYKIQARTQISPKPDNREVQITWLHDNVGSKGFYGHRVYAAFPHLLNHDYIFFLDQDASYEPDHISSMVKLMLEKEYDWAYSLRAIYDREGTFACLDNCESLGEWSAFMNDSVHLVDTSCYGFRRDFLIQVCNHWHFGWGGDRRFFEILTKQFKHTNFGTTGKHSVRYRLGGNENSPKAEMFLKGNEIMKERYNEKFPWISNTKP